MCRVLRGALTKGLWIDCYYRDHTSGVIRAEVLTFIHNV